MPYCETQLCNICADEGLSTVQYVFAMQLVQIRGETRYKFICYATCADEGWNAVELCNLCKRVGLGNYASSFLYYASQQFLGM